MNAIADIFICTAFTLLTIQCMLALVRTIKSRGEHGTADHEQDHTFGHIMACIIGFSGSLFATVTSAVHLFVSNNIAAVGNLRDLETYCEFSYALAALAMILFPTHVKNEETPGHPFWFQHMKRSKKERSRKTDV